MVVSIIIPLFNEYSMIHELIGRVLAANTDPFAKEVIIVDDGSTDGSRERLAALTAGPPVKIIAHGINRGKAAAIKSALAIASGDIILIQDADLEYSPSDYRKILRPFIENNASVVYGSRFLARRWPRGMKLQNWIANKLFTFLTNVLYRAHVSDEGTAYKAFTAEIIKSLQITCTGFAFCPEVTAKILKRRIPIIEVPVEYTARSRQEGKKPGILDGLGILWTIVKFRFTE